MVGGMVSEGRQCYRLPVECWCPRLCAGVPLVVYSVALLNGGCVGLGGAPCVVLPLLVLSSPLSLVVFVVTACWLVPRLCGRVVFVVE